MILLLLTLWSCGTAPTPNPISADAPAAGTAPATPDVLIISIDTLRADRLGFMGYERARTPNLDSLAENGRIYTQATTPVPRTTPALASLQTGLAPDAHGAREVGEKMTAKQML